GGGREGGIEVVSKVAGGGDKNLLAAMEDEIGLGNVLESHSQQRVWNIPKGGRAEPLIDYPILSLGIGSLRRQPGSRPQNGIRLYRCLRQKPLKRLSSRISTLLEIDLFQPREAALLL